MSVNKFWPSKKKGFKSAIQIDKSKKCKWTFYEIFLWQIFDGDNVNGDAKEKLCGDLTSWIPISAKIADPEPKIRSKDYIRNITIK